MKRASLLLSLLFFFIGSFGSLSVQAADIPRPEGDIYVQDFAGLFSENIKTELNQIGRSLEDKTAAQIAVLTVPSTGEETAEEYALQAFRKYGIGGQEKNNGVLLFFTMKNPMDDKRKIRVEVGYGLEGALPDAKVGRILDQYAIPYLQEGKNDLALENTYKAIYNEVAKEYKLDDRVDAKGYSYEEEKGPSLLKVLLIAAGISILVFLDFKFFGGTLTYALLQVLSAIARNRGGGGGSSGPRSGGGGSSGGGGATRSW